MKRVRKILKNIDKEMQKDNVRNCRCGNFKTNTKVSFYSSKRCDWCSYQLLLIYQKAINEIREIAEVEE